MTKASTRNTFSIVATVRNERDTIATFIESLRVQTRSPEEIIIVDGASTDGTREILEGYAERGVLRLISRPCNIAEGRNLGISNATSTHIAVTDAGCRVEREWLAQLAACFETEPGPDVVAGNFRFEIHSPFEDAVVRATFQPNRDDTLTARFYPSSRSVAFSKDAWTRAGGYPEWLYAAEDTLFNIRLRQIGCRFAFCKDAIVRWRPRTSLRELAKQRINFARGNSRVGVGTAGFVINLIIHFMTVALLIAGIFSPWMLLVAAGVFGWHMQRHLWPQAVATTAGDPWSMRLRVLALMEFVRIVSIYGFLCGRMDRWFDTAFIDKQKQYMEVDSVDRLDISTAQPRIRQPGIRNIDAPLTVPLTCMLVAAFAGALAAWHLTSALHWRGLLPIIAVATAGACVLLGKSLVDYSRTGPQIRDDIRIHYSRYSFFALARLCFYAFLLMVLTGGIGALIYCAAIVVAGYAWSPLLAALFAMLAIGFITLGRFLVALRYNPGLLVASMHYRTSRLYPVWQAATPGKLRAMIIGVGVSVIALLSAATLELFAQTRMEELMAMWSVVVAYGGLAIWASWLPDAKPPRGHRVPRVDGPPNILLVGSDTLRADRLGCLGYSRVLTPNIDGLAQVATLFENCYVPCARTAPSLVSLLTGCWPYYHGIRDNFVADEEVLLNVPALPELLAPLGYRSAAIADWCGSDMGKFKFGFDHTDLPEDQWNLKYLIRQGPKDLRLFLSLFLHNRLGRALLPEIYYLGGVPMTSQMGRRVRHQISTLARGDRPFFYNMFYSTTHPPFASEWPWYTRFADPAYTGESKFAMAKLSDPFDIIRRQGAPKAEFDLDQIVDLYDGCVAQFDYEVGRTIEHLAACDLDRNTIVVIYSDHGMEFFEHGSWGQGNSAVGDASPRVPLLIHDPRKPVGARVKKVVRSIDVAPTLLELVGETPPPNMQGVSLARCLGDSAQCPDLDAFTETGIWFTDIPGLPDNHQRYPELLELLDIPNLTTGTLAIRPGYWDTIIAAKDRMIRWDKWKLTYQPLVDGKILQLFDVDSDPEFQHNVVHEHPEIADELWRKLSAWIAL